MRSSTLTLLSPPVHLEDAFFAQRDLHAQGDGPPRQCEQWECSSSTSTMLRRCATRLTLRCSNTLLKSPESMFMNLMSLGKTRDTTVDSCGCRAKQSATYSSPTDAIVYIAACADSLKPTPAKRILKFRMRLTCCSTDTTSLILERDPVSSPSAVLNDSRCNHRHHHWKQALRFYY